MRVNYDSEADAAYISLKSIGSGEASQQVAVKSEAAAGKIILDLDDEGRLVGIEVLNARRGLPADLLDQAWELEDSPLRQRSRMSPELARTPQTPNLVDQTWHILSGCRDEIEVRSGCWSGVARDVHVRSACDGDEAVAAGVIASLDGCLPRPAARCRYAGLDLCQVLFG